jgi:hypothetical protein
MPVDVATRTTAGDVAPEVEIAARVQAQMLPGLRTALRDLRELQEIWLVNGLSETVAAHVVSGEPLAGYAALDWAAWGEVLRQLMEWLDTPIAELAGATPRQVLVKRYTAVQDA